MTIRIDLLFSKTIFIKASSQSVAICKTEMRSVQLRYMILLTVVLGNKWLPNDYQMIKWVYWRWIDAAKNIPTTTS